MVKSVNFSEGSNATIAGNPAKFVQSFIKSQMRQFPDSSPSPTGGWLNITNGSGATVIANNGTASITPAADGSYTDLAVTTGAPTGGRAYINDSVTGLEVGKFYAIVWTFSNRVGVINSNNALISSGAVSPPTISATLDGTWALKFEASATTVGFRFGLGTQAGSTTNCSIRVSNLYCVEIDSLTANIPDYVEPASKVWMKYSAGNTTPSGASGLVTAGSGTLLGNPPRGFFGIGFGDSMSNETHEWPATFTRMIPGVCIDMSSTGGRSLQTYATEAAAIFAGVDVPAKASLADYSFLMICAGINDLVNGRTSAQILGYLNTIIAAKPSSVQKVFVCKIPPFAEWVSWTSGMETERIAYNAALDLRTDVVVCDIESPLKDPKVTPMILSKGTTPWPNYKDNSWTNAAGDGLHPNAEGSGVIGTVMWGEWNAWVNGSGLGSSSGVPTIQIAPGVVVPT